MFYLALIIVFLVAYLPKILILLQNGVHLAGDRGVDISTRYGSELTGGKGDSLTLDGV